MSQLTDKIKQQVSERLERATLARLECDKEVHGPDPIAQLERWEEKITGFIGRHPTLQRMADYVTKDRSNTGGKDR